MTTLELCHRLWEAWYRFRLLQIEDWLFGEDTT